MSGVECFKVFQVLPEYPLQDCASEYRNKQLNILETGFVLSVFRLGFYCHVSFPCDRPKGHSQFWAHQSKRQSKLTVGLFVRSAKNWERVSLVVYTSRSLSIAELYRLNKSNEKMQTYAPFYFVYFHNLFSVGGRWFVPSKGCGLF